MANYVTKRFPNSKLYYFLGALVRFMFTLVACVELYYFSAFLTDNAMFRNAVVVMILSITAVLDLVLSFFISPILSLFHLPWGKIRSWFLVCPPVIAVFYTISFIRFGRNEVFSAVIIIIGFVISHLAWNITEASTSSMSMIATDDPDERVNFGVWLGRGASFAILPFSALATFFLGIFTRINPNFGFGGVALIMSLFYLIACWLLFVFTAYTKKYEKAEEEAAAQKGEKAETALRTLLMGFKYSFSNSHLVITIVSVAVLNFATALMSASTFYVFEYTFAGSEVLGMGLYITVTGVVKIVGSLTVIPLFMALFKGNKKRVFNVCTLLQGVFSVAAFFSFGSPLLCIVLLLISQYFGSVPLITFLNLYQDCSVYSEYRSGRDVSTFIMGLTIMPVKIGAAVKSIVMSGFLVAIGYTASVSDPTVFAKDFAFLHMLLVGVILIAAGIAHTLVYRLPEEKVHKMAQANNRRRALQATGLTAEEAYREVLAENPDL
ncbi:MAG: MFS transporter [Lachnospiraceae bacterium]|nr:MFS transporter [Lachnospiraceae bacterium]